jgi:predicted DNA-binding transcriptional regulator AlpA
LSGWPSADVPKSDSKAVLIPSTAFGTGFWAGPKIERKLGLSAIRAGWGQKKCADNKIVQDDVAHNAETGKGAELAVATQAKSVPAPVVEPVGINAAGVSALLGISTTHFFNLLKTGRFGPEAKRLGRAKRYDREEVLAWFRAGCPSRSRWRIMQGGDR